ncbi:MAG: pentapeptide repeat-containing protein [Pleurocapsa sp. MO_226.B13]|nr:pentapeptide repeat-containing protein [Pleurocapsa sp. MO_226.B13]
MKTKDLLQKYARGRRNFQSIEFSNRRLSWRDLRAIDLSHADCRLSIFGGVDFTAAYLIETNFSRADLTAADLYYANLCGADLSVADLRGASLVCANLSGANLRCASLTGADLSGAIMPDGRVMPVGTILRRRQAIELVAHFN